MSWTLLIRTTSMTIPCLFKFWLPRKPPESSIDRYVLTTYVIIPCLKSLIRFRITPSKVLKDLALINLGHVANQ